MERSHEVRRLHDEVGAHALGRAAAIAAELTAEVERVVIVPPATVETAVSCMLAGGHLMIEDVPGVGKTLLARVLAQGAGLRYGRLQCTADLLPADVTGVSVYHEPSAEFRFRPGPLFANIVLVDEINRASPRTQSALLEAMEEHQITTEGETRSLPSPFMVVATQNPVEYEGTFPLPEAQLDRFMARVRIGYPGPADEAALLLGTAGADRLAHTRAVTDEDGLRAAIAAVSRVHLDPVLAEYVVELAAATRTDPRLALGASPRAALMLARASRARALVRGRDYVLPEDIGALAPSVLAHRLIVAPAGRAEGVSAEDVVAGALRTVPEPEAV